MSTPWYSQAKLQGVAWQEPLVESAPRSRATARAAVSTGGQALVAELVPAAGEAPRGAMAMAAALELVAGRGFNSFTGELRGYPLEPARLGSLLPDLGQTTRYEIRSVQSAGQLREQIGVSAAGSFSGFGVKASAKAEWARDQATSEQSAYLLVRITVQNASLAVSQPRLNEEARRVVASPGFVKEFYRKYGDRYTSEFVTGGEFLGLYEFRTRSSTERERVAAQVEASGGMWSASGEFSAAMERIQSTSESHLSVYVNGGRGALPEFAPAKVLEFARLFPAAVDPAKGFPALYDTVTSDYYAAGGFPGDVDLPFAENHRQLQALAELMDRVRACRRALDHLLLYPQRFQNPGAVDVPAVRKSLQTMEKKLNSAAGVVAESAWREGVGTADALRAELEGIVDLLPDEVAAAVERVTEPGPGHYLVRSASSNLVMDVAGGQIERGARIIMWDRHAGANQLWRFERADDGSYVIRSVLNNRVLDVAGQGRTAGTQLITWDFHGGANQRWRLELQPDDTFLVRSVHNDLVLDVEGASRDRGAALQLWRQHGNDNQRWVLDAL